MAHAKVHKVAPNQKDKSLSHVVEIAVSGDTITVESGTYYEHSIVIDRAVTIIGHDNPVFDAQNKKNEILIVAHDNVHISGLVFKNVAVSFLNDLAAIKVKNSSYGSINNNRFENCFFAIYLGYASHYEVKDNVVRAYFVEEASAGNAIHAWKGDHLEISGNLLTGHRDGIYFEFVDDSHITNNISRNNLRYGLHFMFSNRDSYNGNTFENNGAGVAVMFSKKIQMHNNKFRKNQGGASYGMLLKEISEGSISKNLFEDNTIGIMAEGASRLTIAKNVFISNGKAIDMKGNSLDNKVEANNFVANTFAVVTNSQHNLNTYSHNYWSAYSGYDLDRDGIVDTPYFPVSLFGRITNQIPSANLMIHSFFVNLLEGAEKIFPEIIPAELVDAKPRMKPYNYD
jgi:nitrous oxidase accessory protein